MVYLHVGTKDDVINVDEQFLDGIYNPDFIDDSSDSNDEDGSVSLDNGKQRWCKW